MFYGADAFLSIFDITRVAAITGAPGTGKTLMAFEIAEMYLKKGYSFASNIYSVWNDPLYYSVSQYILDNPFYKKEIAAGLTIEQIQEKYNLPNLCPWVRKRVFVMDEAGRYFRQWKYFQDLAQFPRKFRNYILIPSLRAPHEDLAQLICICSMPLKRILPGNVEGGIFYWQYDNGFSRYPQNGFFVYTSPTTIGVYDTDDLSEVTDGVIQSFTDAIDLRQREYGRNGIQALGNVAQDTDDDAQSAISRRIRQASMALSAASGRKRR